MKGRMMGMGALVALLALTGCQQKSGEPARVQQPGNDAQQGVQGPMGKGETGTGTAIPERGVGELEGTGGAGRGGKADAGMSTDAGTGGAGMEQGGTGLEGMQRGTQPPPGEKAR